MDDKSNKSEHRSKVERKPGREILTSSEPNMALTANMVTELLLSVALSLYLLQKGLSLVTSDKNLSQNLSKIKVNDETGANDQDESCNSEDDDEHACTDEDEESCDGFAMKDDSREVVMSQRPCDISCELMDKRNGDMKLVSSKEKQDTFCSEVSNQNDQDEHGECCDGFRMEKNIGEKNDIETSSDNDTTVELFAGYNECSRTIASASYNGTINLETSDESCNDELFRSSQKKSKRKCTKKRTRRSYKKYRFSVLRYVWPLTMKSSSKHFPLKYKKHVFQRARYSEVQSSRQPLKNEKRQFNRRKAHGRSYSTKHKTKSCLHHLLNRPTELYNTASSPDDNGSPLLTSRQAPAVSPKSSHDLNGDNFTAYRENRPGNDVLTSSSDSISSSNTEQCLVVPQQAVAVNTSGMDASSSLEPLLLSVAEPWLALPCYCDDAQERSAVFLLPCISVSSCYASLSVSLPWSIPTCAVAEPWLTPPCCCDDTQHRFPVFVGSRMSLVVSLNTVL